MTLYFKKHCFFYIYFLHINLQQHHKGETVHLKKKEPTKKNLLRAQLLRAVFRQRLTHRIAATAGFPRLSATWNHSWDFSTAGDSETGWPDRKGVVFYPPRNLPRKQIANPEKNPWNLKLCLSCLKIYVGEKWSKSRHNTKNPWKKSRIIVSHLMSLALSLKPLTFIAVSIDCNYCTFRGTTITYPV